MARANRYYIPGLFGIDKYPSKQNIFKFYRKLIPEKHFINSDLVVKK
jgi:hypothetical protein